MEWSNFVTRRKQPTNHHHHQNPSFLQSLNLGVSCYLSRFREMFSSHRTLHLFIHILNGDNRWTQHLLSHSLQEERHTVDVSAAGSQGSPRKGGAQNEGSSVFWGASVSWDFKWESRDMSLSNSSHFQKGKRESRLERGLGDCKGWAHMLALLACTNSAENFRMVFLSFLFDQKGQQS